MQNPFSRARITVGAMLLLLLCMGASRQPMPVSAGTIPEPAPVLVNGEMECAAGYMEALNEIGQTIRYPAGWLYSAVVGSPKVNSARWQFLKACDGGGDVEKLSGRDSFVLRAQDLETPPTPGKPFDSVIYQQVPVVPGGDYSISGWFVSLCGGSNTNPRNDCPDGYYMAKLLGLDPTGGVDPAAETVIWTENRANFVGADGVTRIGWQNLRLSAVAQGETMTVFARINSPFQHHGNHAFIDAVSLVRAPVVTLDPLPATTPGDTVCLRWRSEQSPDVINLGGTYRMWIDLQQRPVGADDDAWVHILTGADPAGALLYQAPPEAHAVEFRIRVRSEQPPAPPEGIWPNHRFPGTWSAPSPINFRTVPGTPPPDPGEERQYLPMLGVAAGC